MTMLNNDQEEAIGLYSWWQHTISEKILVVVDFSGFPSTQVKVLELHGKEPKTMEIEKFTQLIKADKIRRL